MRKDLHAFRYGLAVALFLALTAGAGAQTFDPCRQMVEVAQPTGTAAKRAIVNLGGFFFDPPEESAPQPFGEGLPHVTINPGRFANLTCNDDEFELQEMYPLGIVVQPLYSLSLPKFEAAERGAPVLVLTEYGQRKIVAEADLSAIRDDQAYVFSDSSAKSMICKDAADCPGNDQVICGSACRYDVSPFYGYAVANSGLPEVAAVLGEYAKVWRDPLLKSLRLTPEELQAALARACMPFPVQAHLRGGTPAQVRDSYLTLCAVRAGMGGMSDNGVAPFKIVDRAYADRMFGEELNGSFHRRFGLGTIAASLGEGTFLDSLTQKKECGDEIENIGAVEANGGLGLKIPGGFLELTAGTKFNLKSEITRTISKDDYLLFSTYFIRQLPDPAAVDQSQDDLWMFNIVFRSACEGGVASKPLSLTIYYEPLPSGSLEIGVKEDLFADYASEWQNTSYKANDDASYLKNGLFWEIVDHQGYFNWRDTIRRYIEKMPDTRDLLERQPSAHRPQIRDFFAYLMLTAAYDHRSPPQ
jgi:hypothetical protein